VAAARGLGFVRRLVRRLRVVIGCACHFFVRFAGQDTAGREPKGNDDGQRRCRLQETGTRGLQQFHGGSLVYYSDGSREQRIDHGSQDLPRRERNGPSPAESLRDLRRVRRKRGTTDLNVLRECIVAKRHRNRYGLPEITRIFFGGGGSPPARTRQGATAAARFYRRLSAAPVIFLKSSKRACLSAG